MGENPDNSVAGAAGFEPAMAGSKPAALTTWPRPSNFFGQSDYEGKD